MNTQSVQELQKAGSAMVMPTVKPERAELLELMAQMFDHVGPVTGYDTLTNVEDKNVPFQELRRWPITGTMFEPMVQKARAMGHEIEMSLGGVMDFFELTRDDIHDICCECYHGQLISSFQVSVNLRAAAKYELPNHVARSLLG